MHEATTNRLSGEYVDPDPAHNGDIRGARRLLVAATFETLPSLFDELATEVCPLYSKSLSLGPVKARRDAQSAFQSAFTKWAGRFYIQEKWLLDYAKEILEHWHKYPEDLANRKWAFLTLGGVMSSFGDVPFELKCPGWDQLNCTWADYKRYVHEQLDEELAEYERVGRELATNAGWELARHTFSMANLHWFVLYQFGNFTYQDIFIKYYQHPEYGAGGDSAVSKGVETARALLNWEHLRGRKKTTKKTT